jgi:hypothetical protein
MWRQTASNLPRIYLPQDAARSEAEELGDDGADHTHHRTARRGGATYPSAIVLKLLNALSKIVNTSREIVLLSDDAIELGVEAPNGNLKARDAIVECGRLL